jgi:hypothetical protein
MDDIGENPPSVFTLELDTVVISNKFHEKKLIIISTILSVSNIAITINLI